MTRAKTTAQWRREVPAYDRMCSDVEVLAPHLPFGGGRAAVAHIDPDTHRVSFIVRVTDADLPALRALVGGVPVTRMEPAPGAVMWVYRGSAPDLRRLLRALGARQ